MEGEHSHQDMVEGRSSAREYAKFAGVIAGIAGVTAAAVVLAELSGVMAWMRIFMGVFFLVFAGFKFAGYRMFALMFAGYDVLAKRFRAYAYAYPFIEAGLGALYLLNAWPLPRDVVTLAAMSVGAIGVAGEIRKRSGVHCACLGNVIRLPLSTVSLVEDVAMGLMALIMIAWNLF